MAAGAPKSPNNLTSTFLNTVHFLPIDLSFKHGGAKLASCPARHLTSLRAWVETVLSIQQERTTYPKTNESFLQVKHSLPVPQTLYHLKTLLLAVAFNC